MKHFPTPVKLFVNLFFNQLTLRLTSCTAENTRRCRRGAHYIDSKTLVNTLLKFLFKNRFYSNYLFVHHFEDVDLSHTDRTLETNRITFPILDQGPG